MTADTPNQGAPPAARLILFVTADSPRSRRARVNLARALQQAGLEAGAPREINLLEEPGKAVEHGIFATPALLDTVNPDNPAVIYGDLSDEAGLQRFLAGLE